SVFSLATFNGSTSNTVEFDIYAQATSNTNVQYIAAVIGYGTGADSYFIKIQRQLTAAGQFTHYAFYKNDHDSDGGLFSSLSQGFQSAHVIVTIVGSVATLSIDPDTGPNQVYTFDYGFA